MSDTYTEIMESVRAKCPDCADKLTEIHRLLHKINSPKLESVLELARKLTNDYTRGMADDDPAKGDGNRLADALDAYDGDKHA